MNRTLLVPGALNYKFLTPAQRVQHRINALSDSRCRLLIYAKDLLDTESIDIEDYHYIVALARSEATEEEVISTCDYCLLKLQQSHHEYKTLGSAQKRITTKLLDLDHLKI